MTLKKSPQGLEFSPTFSLPQGIQKRLTPELAHEAEYFIKRNTLHFIDFQGKPKPVYCPQCLKAHLIKMAEKEMLFDRKDLLLLSKIFPCQTGHAGFYLDNEKLKEAGD